MRHSGPGINGDGFHFFAAQGEGTSTLGILALSNKQTAKALRGAEFRKVIFYLLCAFASSRLCG